MKKEIKIYDLKDPRQYEDDKVFWENKTPEEKLEMLEVMRKTWFKLKGETNGNHQRLQRILRIVDPE